MNTKHFVALDGLRGIAAIVVVFYHIATIPFVRAPVGFLAVDFFFALSGFVIAHAYKQRLSSELHFPDFVRLRIARLYPILFLGFFLASARGLALCLTGNLSSPSVEELIFGSTFNLLLIPIPIFGVYMFLNVPTWSLMFELLVNILYAYFISFITRSLMVFLMLTSALALIYIAYSGSFGDGGTLNSFGVGLARVIFSFSGGLLLYDIYPSLPKVQVSPYVLCVLVFFSLAFPYRSAEYELFFVFVLTPSFLLLGANSYPFIGAKFLGDASYPIYALHYSLISIGSYAASKLAIEPWIGMLATILIYCAFSPFVTRWYDLPLRRILRSIMLPKSARNTL